MNRRISVNTTGFVVPQSFITKSKQRLKQHIDTVYLNNGDEFEVELFNPTQNKVLYYPFYDTGNYSFSAISYNLGTLTTTSDVVSMAFYTMGQVPIIGLSPKDLIMSGITLESATSTGVKTTTLPSTLSFSGTGGGYYIAAFYVSNSGTTPTVRYGSPNVSANNQSFAATLGFYLNSSGTGTNVGQRFPATVGTGQMSVLNLPFQQSYSTADITTNVSSTLSNALWGFGLNTIF
jgi:hypothetical protein